MLQGGVECRGREMSCGVERRGREMSLQTKLVLRSGWLECRGREMSRLRMPVGATFRVVWNVAAVRCHFRLGRPLVCGMSRPLAGLRFGPHSFLCLVMSENDDEVARWAVLRHQRFKLMCMLG